MKEKKLPIHKKPKDWGTEGESATSVNEEYFKDQQVKGLFKWYERLYMWLRGIRW